MEKEIRIDFSLCKKCKVCVEICPNGIFKTDNNLTSVRQERIELCFLCGQCMAACPEKAIHVPGLDYNIDFFDIPEALDCEVPFDNLIQSRRSVRAFKNMPLPKDILEQIVKAITFAPPSFPPLKTEIVVVQDKELINKSLPHMVNWYNDLLKRLKNPLIKYIIHKKAGPERFQTIQNHVVPMFRIKLPSMLNSTEDAITRNAQAIILFHADRHSDNYRSDIYIALGYALLKAHSLGIGASAIDLIPPAVERIPYLKNLFQIPEENEVVASMILGYPKYKYKRAIHRQLKSVTWI
jgi:NAD-dependent dihydropyrimidine dehydrogenase PreA subunit/nitroreductase